MAVGMLDGLDVAHDGLGEVGQVAPTEERLRQFAQALGKADALPAALLVDDAVLVVVGEVLGDEQRGDERGEARQIWDDVRQRRAAHEMVGERAHRHEDDSHTAEHRDVGHRGPRRAQFDVAHALVGESVLLPDRHHATSADVIFQSAAFW